MKIQEVRRAGEGVEIKIENKWYWFELDTTKEEIKEIINTPDNFDSVKFKKLKDLENTEI